MANKIPVFLILILFLTGAGILAYPVVSSYLSKVSQGEVISDYSDQLEQLAADEIEEQKRKSEKYNQQLSKNVILTDPFSVEDQKESNEEYESLLNIQGNGMMGMIEIPRIDVKLPIYHGTDIKILEKGVGHLEMTSLPVGGVGSHTVLSAHSGLPSAKLFTDLILLEKGDCFYLNILDEVFAYEINQIKVVEPEETKDLFINKEKDYVTLVTCTPYGINSHRLLVRGERIPYIEKEKEKIQTVKKEENTYGAYLILLPILAVVSAAVRIKNHRDKKYKK